MRPGVFRGFRGVYATPSIGNRAACVQVHAIRHGQQDVARFIEALA